MIPFMPNFAFLGQKPIGTACFKALLDQFDSSNVKFVVSNSRPKGWWNDNEIFQLAKTSNTDFFDLDEVDNNGLQILVEKYEIDYLISVQYNKIISQQVLDLVLIDSFNLHLAPLPEYRGWHSASHCILNSDSSFGSTIHKINAQIDDGEIFRLRSFRISDESAGQLYYQSEIAGIDTFLELLDQFRIGAEIFCYPQIGQKRRYREKDLLRRIESDDIPDFIKRRAVDFSFRLQNRNIFNNLKK
jgi:methionyl-tRNA formyltransferase